MKIGQFFSAFFQSMVADNTGGVSSMRVMMSLWLLILFVAWVVRAFNTEGALPDIPTGVLGLTTMLVSAKVIQRFGEKDGQGD